MSCPGIGDWTAQYIAMRALRWPDAFPAGDLGLLKALGATSPRRLLETAAAWRPWRAYAAMYLWQCQDLSGTTHEAARAGRRDGSDRSDRSEAAAGPTPHARRPNAPPKQFRRPT